MLPPCYESNTTSVPPSRRGVKRTTNAAQLSGADDVCFHECAARSHLAELAELDPAAAESASGCDFLQAARTTPECSDAVGSDLDRWLDLKPPGKRDREHDSAALDKLAACQRRFENARRTGAAKVTLPPTPAGERYTIGNLTRRRRSRHARRLLAGGVGRLAPDVHVVARAARDATARRRPGPTADHVLARRPVDELIDV